jgi:murein tripeptide amidase MpaA
MPDVAFNRFYRYDDLTRLLNEYAAEYPQLCKVESIGKSYEGRDVWLVTVTNTATGPAAEKPALWVDGNLHASEVAGSAAALYFIHSLVTRYGKDKTTTDCLDTRAFYIVPRVNPDGAEWALADKPRIIRSSTRPYPYDEEPVEGLLQEDIDGDGRILTMRILDPNGAWKAHPDDPRLMVRRDPVESGGSYYRLLPEGFLRNFDGVTIQPRGPKEGLDLNRNFPIGWRQDNDQPGSGPYPAS